MVEQGPGHIQPRGLLQSFPARYSVDLENVGSSVPILYKIHPGVICADRGGSPQGQNLGIFRQLYCLSGRAPGQIGTPTGGSAFDGRKELSSNHECPDIYPAVVYGALQVIDSPDLLQSAENPECHFLILNS